MPPDPILALLSLVGLFVYGGVGAIVGTLTLRVFDGWDGNTGNSSYLRGIAKKGGDEDGWVGFGFASTLWPVVLSIGIVVAACMAVAIGPVWCSVRIGTYVAAAQIKESSDAS